MGELLSQVFLVVIHLWHWWVIGFLVISVLDYRFQVRKSYAVNLPLVAMFCIFLYFLHGHQSGQKIVSGLEKQFREEVMSWSDSSDAPKSLQTGIDIYEIILARNLALHQFGFCADGEWWGSKSTGEEPRVYINTLYYRCPRYVSN